MARMAETASHEKPTREKKRDKPLFVLVDGYSLLFRAFHSMGDMKTPEGLPTGALFGLTSMLIKVMEDLKPDYLLVAFDYHAPTFRHETFADYKAHRDKAPDELKIQMAMSRELVSALGIDYEELKGYEADDIIGTLARQAEKLGWNVKILTGDSDLAQLVSDRITVVQTIKGVTENRIMDPAFVKQRYGVKEPENLTDYKGLVGDPSDNIPGVKGVGEVTAKKLLAEHPTIEQIYKNLDKIDEKIRSKLVPGKDLALLSKKLATIKTDLPIKMSKESAEKFHFDLSHMDKHRALSLFRKLGFKSLAQRLGLEWKAEGESGVPITWKVVSSQHELEDLVSRLKRSDRFALDYETSDIDARKADIVGIAVSIGEDLGWYIPTGHILSITEEYKQIPVRKALDALKPLFEDEKIEKICQNGKFEWLVSNRAGIELNGLVDDPMIADYLLDPDRRHGLKEMAQRELGWTMTTIEELIGKRGKNQKTMAEVPIGKAAPYASADAVSTWNLIEKFTPLLKKDGLYELYREIEIPLVTVLARMEAVGIHVNARVLEDMASDLDQRMEDISRVIFQRIGHEINLNSPKQLAELLFDEMKLPTVRERSTDAEVLEKLSSHHEVPAMIMEFRTLSKLRGTYTLNLIELIGDDGRIHTSYNQTVAGTGRLSSSDPNLQNIPIRTDLGQRIRRAFEPNRKGDTLLSADYSQMELRLLAHFSEDKKLIESFRNDEDIHKRTAMEVFGVSADEVTHEMRRNAKVVNFGIIYGMGPHGLSEALGKPRSECKAFIDRFFERFPGVKAYLDESVAFGRKHGYVKTALGRRKYYPELNSENRMKRAAAERAAINMPLQGTSADIIKIAMVRLVKMLDDAGLPEAVLLQVHDELVLSLPEKRLGEIAEMVGCTMSQVLPLKVPMVVNCKAGPNWLDMTGVGDFKALDGCRLV
jgi:DNA polymerase-1